MSKEVEYRAQAVSCLDLARHTANGTDRLRILRIAAGWLDLADGVKRALNRPDPGLPEAPELRALFERS